MRKDLFLVKEFSSLLDFMLKSCLFLHTEKDITRLLDQKRILVNDELVSDFVNLKPGDKVTVSGPYGEFFLKDNDNEMRTNKKKHKLGLHYQ